MIAMIANTISTDVRSGRYNVAPSVTSWVSVVEWRMYLRHVGASN